MLDREITFTEWVQRFTYPKDEPEHGNIDHETIRKDCASKIPQYDRSFNWLGLGYASEWAAYNDDDCSSWHGISNNTFEPSDLNGCL